MIRKMKSLLKWPCRKMLQKIFNAGAESVRHEFAYRALSYSQDGEDIILDNFFQHKPVGFYIDVGAHHPQRFSNTKLFYDRGWHGISIEPNLGVVKLFKAQRPRDIHLCLGLAQVSQSLKYYQFADPAINTLSNEVRVHFESQGLGRVIQTIEVPCVTLRSIFEKYVQGQKVDFLTIDTEGLDFVVLSSNN